MQHIRAEVGKWGKVAKAANIKVEQVCTTSSRMSGTYPHTSVRAERARGRRKRRWKLASSVLRRAATLPVQH